MKQDFDSKIYEEKFKSLILDIYNHGYNDCKAASTHSIKLNNIEYFDLGLPSGTLWSNPITYFDFGYKLAMFTYEEAMSMEIPTIEQFIELLKHCRINGMYITGHNCAKIGYQVAATRSPYLIYNRGEGTEKNENKFWIKSKPDYRHEATAMIFDDNILKAGKHFIGFKLPIMLVKNI